jgi:hypothetical protein
MLALSASSVVVIPHPRRQNSRWNQASRRIVLGEANEAISLDIHEHRVEVIAGRTPDSTVIMIEYL